MVHIIELVGQPKVEFAQQVTVSIKSRVKMNFHTAGCGDWGGGGVLGKRENVPENDNKSCCPQSRNDNLIQIHMHTSPRTH